MGKSFVFLAVALFVGLGNVTSQTGFSKDVMLKDFFRDDSIKFLNRFVGNPTGGFISPYIFSDVDQTFNELLSANVKFVEKDQAFKLSVSPLRLMPAYRTVSRVLFSYRLPQIIKENFKISANYSKSIFSLGGSIGYDNSAPRSKRAKRIREEEFKIAAWDGSPATKDSFLLALNQAKANYLSALNRHVYRLSAGFTEKLFSVLGSKISSPDSTSSYKDTANYHIEKGNTVSLNANYSINYPHFAPTITGGVYYTMARPNAQKVAGGRFVPYLGYSIGINYRVARFISTSQLKTNDSYLKTGFIPAIYIGVTYEYQNTKVNASQYRYIEDAIKTKTVITPNLDICLSSTAQFRIGIPITENKKVDGKKEISAGATVQISFRLSNLLE